MQKDAKLMLSNKTLHVFFKKTKTGCCSKKLKTGCCPKNLKTGLHPKNLKTGGCRKKVEHWMLSKKTWILDVVEKNWKLDFVQETLDIGCCPKKLKTGYCPKKLKTGCCPKSGRRKESSSVEMHLNFEGWASVVLCWFVILKIFHVKKKENHFFSIAMQHKSPGPTKNRLRCQLWSEMWFSVITCVQFKKTRS